MIKKEFRCNAVEMTRAIKDKIDAEFPTIDALFEHLVKRRENNANNSNLLRSKAFA